jgi:hypothetical protein
MIVLISPNKYLTNDELRFYLEKKPFNKHIKMVWDTIKWIFSVKDDNNLIE